MKNILNLGIGLLVACFLFSSCATAKKNHGKLRYKNIGFSFDNCCLALTIEGEGKLNVYENYIRVYIHKGSISLNKEYAHIYYNVGEIRLSLGKHIDFFEDKWDYFNHGKYQLIQKNILDQNDVIDISGMKFDIPYTHPSELVDAWIVVSVRDISKKKYNYAHSTYKIQKFSK
jgi:hypothetical protein